MERDYQKIEDVSTGKITADLLNVHELRTFCYKHRKDLKPSEVRSWNRETLLAAIGTTVSDESDVIELTEAIDPLPAPENGNGKKGDLAAVIAAAIQGHIQIDTPGIDENRVNQLIDARLKNHTKTLEVKNIDTGKISQLELTHETLPKLLTVASCRLNAFLVGPAGSGKTFACEQVAQALDLESYTQSVGLQTSKSDLLGYMDANGNYVESLLFTAYKNGGVFCLDEIDAGNPNVLTVINAMTSNHRASFPCGMVDKHPDFILVACGNTYGRGSDRRYVGRNKLDAATLDRFCVIDFDYDDTLEYNLCADKYWLAVIWDIRKIAADLKEDLIVSPRASINGSKLLAAGMDKESVMDMVIFKGVSVDVKERILNNLKG